jgi:predicted nucleic acid-binding protein
MIFLDANIFLRLLVKSDQTEDKRRQVAARSLLERAEQGEVQVTTSELVIHEICYVLTSKRQYGLPVAEVVPMIRAFFSGQLLSLSVRERSEWLRALEIWLQHSDLEFADSLYAAKCELNDWELATFDRGFDKLSISRASIS